MLVTEFEESFCFTEYTLQKIKVCIKDLVTFAEEIFKVNRSLYIANRTYHFC